ncbi:uncharacterized protein LOC128157790 [Crassostrea angulata]|uniref:uncharacterized protein LOC128157790 n=1 Tax=Magallana angulata TaxID=2784310 RepID=UPI0022B0D40B|nr:uncharacterized protein LOC128157790 [Crassostrea angulata]
MESISTQMYEGMQHMSEAVFFGMSWIVGTSYQLAMRRRTVDIWEMVKRGISQNDWAVLMMGGSYREGFRWIGSDIDWMLWPNNHRVIMDKSQSGSYNTANTTLILSDISECSPGFTLLQLLTPSKREQVKLACVRMNDRNYISSSKIRQLSLPREFPDSTQHGPCYSGCVAGMVEFDLASCFACDFWPPSATAWTDRCHSWPDPEVGNDIVNNGCHFVAIGHPLGLHQHEEWRISFTQAENKLVNSMNHCQFLTYALLKFFLKEVINLESEEPAHLLCSYHMKTAVFWAIQQNLLSHWCPQNFLAGFWVCFKLLLKWVHEGVCPNFFIPQNNLFLTKVHGSAQNRLFLQFHELYEKGLACLLQSSTIRSCLIDALCYPRVFICTDQNIMQSEVDKDLEIISESCSYIFDSQTPISGNPSGLSKELCRIIKGIHIMEQLVVSTVTPYQVILLQKLTSTVLRYAAFLLHMNTNESVNKKMYIADKLSCHMLKFAANFGYVSDLLHIAMYYYKTGRYRKALSVIDITKARLAKPYLVYLNQVDREIYTEALGGQSWSTKIRQAVAEDIRLDNQICYIKELVLEQRSGRQKSMVALNVPVFVMLHFLEFLCYRHIDTTLSLRALDELQVLVHYDEGHYLGFIFRDISWEILGICQHIRGNRQGALYSFQQSLNVQYPYNRIQAATQRRIQDVQATSYQ